MTFFGFIAFFKRVFAHLALSLVFFATIPSVLAQAQTNSVVVEVIIASNQREQTDPALMDHTAHLAMQFANFTMFTLHSSGTFSLDSPASIPVPGGILQIMRTSDDSLRLTMPNGHQTTIGIPAGSVHFQLGSLVEGGTLLIAIEVN